MDAYWAHVLWQRHGLRIEDYEKMTEAQKAFYIASERYEDEHPCRKDGSLNFRRGSRCPKIAFWQSKFPKNGSLSINYCDIFEKIV